MISSRAIQGRILTTIDLFALDNSSLIYGRHNIRIFVNSPALFHRANNLIIIG